MAMETTADLAASEAQAVAETAPPLVAHVVFNLDIGGLENGVVNLINNMPRDAFRHAIVCIKGATDFRRRLQRPDVSIITLGQQPGLDPASYLRAWRTFGALRPQIVHTRNLAALEMQLPALLAHVPHRVHSEHGRDGRDLQGNYRRYNFVRKMFRPLVHRYVAMSRDLEDWLVRTIEVDAARVEQIYNGVDTDRFFPHRGPREPFGPAGFADADSFVIGAVGRMVPVKDHATLVRAFARLATLVPAQAARLRLVFLGDGSCRRECEQLAAQLGVADRCWFAGDRDDVATIVRQFDLFCLSSLNEGINNTVLEAMACGLPVIATRVGGNPELVIEGVTGTLVQVASDEGFALAMQAYLADAQRRRSHGENGRRRAEADFSIPAMVGRYAKLYEGLMSAPAPRRR
jgi:sugar transferase (PEP-CTERM/EpsH1 system associated)